MQACDLEYRFGSGGHATRFGTWLFRDEGVEMVLVLLDALGGMATWRSWIRLPMAEGGFRDVHHSLAVTAAEMRRGLRGQGAHVAERVGRNLKQVIQSSERCKRRSR